MNLHLQEICHRAPEYVPCWYPGSCRRAREPVRNCRCKPGGVAGRCFAYALYEMACRRASRGAGTPATGQKRWPTGVLLVQYATVTIIYEVCAILSPQTLYRDGAFL